MTYITAISFVFTAISALILGTKHLRHYTVPKEQRQIIRTVLMPLSFGIIAFLSVVFYEQSIYLKPIMQVYEALCVSALFFLFLEYVCPEADRRAAYFSAVEQKNKKGNVIPGGSLLWFNVRFTYPTFSSSNVTHSNRGIKLMEIVHLGSHPPIPPYETHPHHHRNQHSSRKCLLHEFPLAEIRTSLGDANRHLHRW